MAASQRPAGTTSQARASSSAPAPYRHAFPRRSSSFSDFFEGEDEDAVAREWEAETAGRGDSDQDDDDDDNDNAAATAGGRAVAVPGGRRRRRDSQVGTYESDQGDASGSIFDGPGSVTVPSSVTSMHHQQYRPSLYGRRSSQERLHLSKDTDNRRRRRRSSAASAHTTRTSRSVDHAGASRGPPNPRSVRSSMQVESDLEDPASYSSDRMMHARRGSMRSAIGYVPPADVDGHDEQGDASASRSGVFGSFISAALGGRPRRKSSSTTGRHGKRPSSSRRESPSSTRRIALSRNLSSSSLGSRASSRRTRRSDYAVSGEESEGYGGWAGEDEDEGEEEEEEADEVDRSSLRSSGTLSDEEGDGLLPSAFGTLAGGHDPLFGDTRISMDRQSEDQLDLVLDATGEAVEEVAQGGDWDEQDESMAELHRGHLDQATGGDGDHGASKPSAQTHFGAAHWANPACKSRQQIYLPEEDMLIRFTGYRNVLLHRLLWAVGCVCTFGVLYLLGRWLPRLRLRWVSKEESFAQAEFVVVENQWGDLHLQPFSSVSLHRPLSSVFPPSSRQPPATQYEAADQANVPLPTDHQLSGSRSVPQSRDVSRRVSPSPAPLDSHAPNGLAANDGRNGDGGDGSGLSATSSAETVAEGEILLSTMRYVDYRYTRFALHPPTGKLRMVKEWRDPAWSGVPAVMGGVSEKEAKWREKLFGKNVIDIEGKGVGQLLVDEVLHPFYMFQVVSILLWSIDDYYYYAFCIAVISITSIATSLIETIHNIRRMREMSKFTCSVRVWRDEQWVMRDSSELVPGDIFDVAESSLTVFPCDSVLLTGDAIVNESMLTGESVPIAKLPITDAGILSLTRPGSTITSDLAKHFLFSGTSVIRVRTQSAATSGGVGTQLDQDDCAKAMVVRTGFDTTKGALVRSMLFPKPMGFKFYRDSFRFIGVLAIIAGVGFMASSVNFVKLGIAWHTILLRCADLITVVIPPALPATMSIGTTFAISRLRKAGIFCISPNRVNIGGKINVFCFDKTGTLTEDGLDVLGVRTIDKRSNRFSELHEDIDDVPGTEGKDGRTPLLYVLATCHSLNIVNEEIIGDPLDVKMFDFTKWTLEEGKQTSSSARSKAKSGGKLPERRPALVQSVVRPPGGQSFQLEDALKPERKHAHFLELGVIRTFEFASSLRRMSVVVKRLKSQSMEIYAKGAPEVMADICDPDSFPEDYDDLLSYYTHHGYRVIACAGKTMQGMSWIKAQRMKREQAESGLRFLGLIIFENKLKSGTIPAMDTLLKAHLVCKMCTGDNPRTAISVARECHMVGQSAHIFMPTFTEGGPTLPRSALEWTSVDDERLKLDPYSLKTLELPTHHGAAFEQIGLQDYQLAVTGDVFRWMIDYAPLETLRRMLIKGQIFARMSPDEKHELVERLQGLGYTVGFCGDGANDCGALKAADVGISLSEAEASVAAPFTSRSPDISCVIEVIKEGRAALVTSFSCFKYMALYSLIQFTTITILYSFASSLGDFQFLYIDLFIILPTAVAMSRTHPYPKIHPKRPTANLVSKKVLASMMGQVVICAAIQAFVFFHVRNQPWYTPPKVRPDELNVVNPENSALFMVSSFQYIVVAAVFSVGPPYRKPIYTNPLLVASLVCLSLLSLYFLFVPSGFVFDILGLVHFPRSFHYQLLFIVLVNTLLSFAFEKWGVPRAVRLIKWLQRRWRRLRGERERTRRKSGKVYKSVEVDMRE